MAVISLVSQPGSMAGVLALLSQPGSMAGVLALCHNLAQWLVY